MTVAARLLVAMATLSVLAVPAFAASRCTLETDGATHTLPHIYVASEEVTHSDLAGARQVTQHWIFCSRYPIEPNPTYGDWLVATRMAILQLAESDRAEVLLAHDGKVRRAGMTWGGLEAESPLDDPDLPLRFEGTVDKGHARGQLVTERPMEQGPTPWHDAAFQWRIAIELDAPVLGAQQ